MIFQPTRVAGAFLIDVEPRTDERGFFGRTFCGSEFAAQGIDFGIEQCSVSYNERQGTLRGMHFQGAPYEEQKLVRCTAGAVFDVIADLRPDSATYRHWQGVELSAENRRAIYIPRGVAHGFISLTDAAELLYLISIAYVPGYARGVRWNDPRIGIQWPLQPSVISARDAQLPLLE